jgi:CRISPR/Cas system CSM-associated protein Csm3 (group 7 of RAMP superfamily)
MGNSNSRGYFNVRFHIPKQKSHPKVAKLLIDMVGDTWIEHVTPAV